MLREEQDIIPYETTDLTGKRVLVFSPHPDDETIGCGGSLAIHTRAGDLVKLVILTNGAMGDFSGKATRDEYIARRKNEAIHASKLLGIDDIEFWGYEDRNLAGSKEAISRMVDLLRKYKPGMVYVPSPLEFHPDHRAASFFVCEAIRKCAWECEVAFYELGQAISVNCLVDISGTLDLKINAIKAYESQLEELPYLDISIALNRLRSLTLPKEVTHAEGFFVINAHKLKEEGPLAVVYYFLNRVKEDFEYLLKDG